jgi:8-oxo-dGTP pyrophosphatase MutT (NUDIX family)
MSIFQKSVTKNPIYNSKNCDLKKMECKNYDLSKFECKNFENIDIKCCGMIVLNNTYNPLVLLVYQKVSKKWGLPKGHMNSREYIEKDYYLSAERELFEETGIYLSAKDHRYIGCVLLSEKLFFVVQIYSNSINIDPIDKNEISDYTWHPIFSLEDFVENNNCNRTMRDLMYTMRQFKRPKKRIIESKPLLLESKRHNHEFKNNNNSWNNKKNIISLKERKISQQKFNEKYKSYKYNIYDEKYTRKNYRNRNYR